MKDAVHDSLGGRGPDTPDFAESVHFDNLFRLVVSIATFSIATALYFAKSLADLTPLAWLIVAYTVPYLTVWIWLEQAKELRWITYALSVVDFAAITWAVVLTGGLQSPFFYLFPIPFLVHSLHFDRHLIGVDGGLCLVGYSVLLWREKAGVSSVVLSQCAGQLVFLCIIIGAALYTSYRFGKKHTSQVRGLKTLRTTVEFLENLGRLPPGLTTAELQARLVTLLQEILRPFGIHCRVWIVNTAWRTLQGVGEHPALRPGSPHHLPTVACPAFALRRPFRYDEDSVEPCRSEQFNYGKHLCVPLANEQECFGVLFLGSYGQEAWDPEELHLFNVFAQSIALTLQRKGLFDSLQEKVSELNFSFEVGATGLATFFGSTQSIDETTVHILDGVRSILKVDRASLMLWNSEDRRLETQWVRGGDFKIQSPLQLEMGEGMAGWALKTEEPYWSEYAMGDPHYAPSAQRIQSLLCVPVYTMDRQPLGVINAVTIKSTREFKRREIEFLKWFGQQAALAIENAQLHHRNRSNIDQLSELNQMKSQFLSLVSHDLRGPLTGVRGFCEVLKQQVLGTLSAGQLDLLDQLERQVNLQERMVDDLLDLARMEKGKLSILMKATNVQALLREEVDKSQIEAQERKIALRLQETNLNELPRMVVDDGRIRQVIWNLIHNALKFTGEDGHVIVRANADGKTLTVEVEDTGVGLSAETQERVFEKFFQLSPGGSKSAQGLGLGLAICKEIVLAHQGRIWARSPGLGLGTTIAFTLPVRIEGEHPNQLAA
jgi:signal transduction histidine kinase